MNSCKCLLEVNGKLSDLNALEILRALLNRLSVRVQERFAEIFFKREIAGESAIFLNLVDLVSRASRFSETEWARQLFQAQGEVARPMGKFRKPETRKPTAKTFAEARNSLKKSESVAVTSCLFCQGEHRLWQCKEFADQSVSVRKRFSVQNLLCFNCLKPGHRAVSCKLKRTCESCGKKPNTLLHESTFFSVNNEDHSSDQKSVVALTKNNNENVERSNVLQSILPVQVWSENNSARVSTYVLLDTGSTTSLCTTSLVNKLNISINRGSTELQGVNSINRCSGRIGPLSMKGLEEHEVCQLRSVGVVNNLPDMRENVALENVVQQYKHISD